MNKEKILQAKKYTVKCVRFTHEKKSIKIIALNNYFK